MGRPLGRPDRGPGRAGMLGRPAERPEEKFRLCRSTGAMLGSASEPVHGNHPARCGNTNCMQGADTQHRFWLVKHSTAYKHLCGSGSNFTATPGALLFPGGWSGLGPEVAGMGLEQTSRARKSKEDTRGGMPLRCILNVQGGVVWGHGCVQEVAHAGSTTTELAQREVGGARYTFEEAAGACTQEGLSTEERGRHPQQTACLHQVPAPTAHTNILAHTDGALPGLKSHVSTSQPPRQHTSGAATHS
eukprot:1145207-Pelagomonas_calceolata.AAC.4